MLHFSDFKRSYPLHCAEGEGFKPPIPERGIPDFESSAIVHSANLPLFCNAKVAYFFFSTKFSPGFFLSFIFPVMFLYLSDIFTTFVFNNS